MGRRRVKKGEEELRICNGEVWNNRENKSKMEGKAGKKSNGKMR
jgi:hypothetical protein